VYIEKLNRFLQTHWLKKHYKPSQPD